MQKQSPERKSGMVIGAKTQSRRTAEHDRVFYFNRLLERTWFYKANNEISALLLLQSLFDFDLDGGSFFLAKRAALSLFRGSLDSSTSSPYQHVGFILWYRAFHA